MRPDEPGRDTLVRVYQPKMQIQSQFVGEGKQWEALSKAKNMDIHQRVYNLGESNPALTHVDENRFA